MMDADVIYAAVGNRMYAISRETGGQLWRYPAGAPIQANFRTGAHLSGNMMVAAADNRNVYAVDRVTGAEMWVYQSPFGILGTPRVVGNSVAVPLEGGRMVVLNGSTGAVDGEAFDLPGGHSGQFAVAGSSLVYVSEAGQLTSFDPGSRRVDWQQRLERFSRTTPPVVFEGTIYVNSGSYAVAIRSSNGRVAWQSNVGEDLVYSPAVNEDYVGVVAADGTVQILNRDNGRPVTGPKLRTQLPPATSPSFVGKMFITNGVNGSVNVIDPVTEQLVFTYRIPMPPVTADPNAPTGPGAGRGAGGGGGGNAGAGAGDDGGGQAGGADDDETKVDYVAASGPAIGMGDSLIVMARDGSILNFDKNLGVDLTAPFVEMQWPGSGEVIWARPPLNFLFNIADFGSGLNSASVNVTINGRKYQHVLTPDGRLFVVIGNSAPNPPLSNGRQEIVVSASDWLGNEIKKTFVVVADVSLAPPASNQGTSNTGPGAGSGGGGRGNGGGGRGRGNGGG